MKFIMKEMPLYCNFKKYEKNMNDNPLVSVIIPAYNAGKYIESAVKSVFNQSYNNIELVVVNDGSTDNTLDILSQFSSIKIISTPNKGVSHARNTGIDVSKGEYIFFLDADDELEYNAIAILLQICKKNNADICGGLAYSTQKKEVKYSERFLDGDALLHYCIEDNPNTYVVWAKLYKRCFIDKTRFPIGMRVAEDSFFNCELSLKKPKCVFISKIIYFYRVHEMSLSREKESDTFLDINQLSKIKYEMILKKFPEYKDYAKNILIKSDMAVLKKIMTFKNADYENFEKKCIKNICENAAYFIPATKFDKKFFFIITHHLYYLFKIYFNAKVCVNFF